MFGKIARDLEKEFNQNRTSGPEFAQLDTGQKTLLYSLKHQYGSGFGKNTNPEIKEVFSYAAANEWGKVNKAMDRITP